MHLAQAALAQGILLKRLRQHKDNRSSYRVLLRVCGTKQCVLAIEWSHTCGFFSNLYIFIQITHQAAEDAAL